MFFKSVILAFIMAPLAKADLVMEQQFGDTNVLGQVTLKIHADKMRMDQQDTQSNVFSVIIDLDTRDSYTLMPETKMFRKRSGADIRRQVAALVKAGDTNIIAPAPAVDTGNAEPVDGRETEIYTWSSARGVNETLWVATNYPDYAVIRKELAKIDQFNAAGPHRNAQPELGPLPGMVVKTQTTIRLEKTFTTTLVSAKVEPVDASLFELPADYKPWLPPDLRSTNTIATPAKSP
jgi:hypothetical protein